MPLCPATSDTDVMVGALYVSGSCVQVATVGIAALGCLPPHFYVREKYTVSFRRVIGFLH